MPKAFEYLTVMEMGQNCACALDQLVGRKEQVVLVCEEQDRSVQIVKGVGATELRHAAVHLEKAHAVAVEPKPGLIEVCK